MALAISLSPFAPVYDKRHFWTLRESEFSQVRIVQARFRLMGVKT